MEPRPVARDGGFTLVEVLTVTVLLLVLMGIAVGAWRGYAAARSQSGAAEEIRESLRQAQQQAVTEGRSICVDFAAVTYQRYRGACGTGPLVPEGPLERLPDGVRVATSRFVVGPDSTTTGVTFSSRGTASPGLVTLTRTGADTRTSVTVEGLTGRVSLD